MLLALAALILIEVVLLWIRSEYMFVLFYVVANFLIVFLLRDLWTLTWAQAPNYLFNVTLGLAVQIAIGCAIVAVFKWIKTRKTGRDKQLDKEIEAIRAEVAARDQSSS